MKYKDNELKLIYVLKIGYNSKGEGLYEFIFSHDETNIDVEGWLWDKEPAVDNAEPPDGEYVDKIISLKTKSFDLFCLHEAVDRPYIHGYYTIHALAYEIEKQNNDENDFDDYNSIFNEENDFPLLVFHYGMTLTKIKDILKERKIILKNNEFIEVSSIEITKNDR